MPDFYTNVKSRLNKKGVTGIPKSFYFDAAIEVGVEDVKDATTEQITEAVELLISRNSTQMVPASSSLPPLSPDEGNKDSALSLSSPSALDLKKQSPPPILRSEELELVAEEIGANSASVSEGIAEIEAAITDYIDYHHSRRKQDIEGMVSSVSRASALSNQDLSAALGAGLTDIAKTLKQGDADFKSQVTSSLRFFKAPRS